jgi:hypothetical protein
LTSWTTIAMSIFEHIASTGVSDGQCGASRFANSFKGRAARKPGMGSEICHMEDIGVGAELYEASMRQNGAG